MGGSAERPRSARELWTRAASAEDASVADGPRIGCGKRLCNGRESVPLSVRPSVRQSVPSIDNRRAAATCSRRFAHSAGAGGIYRAIPAARARTWTAASVNAVIRRTRLLVADVSCGCLHCRRSTTRSTSCSTAPSTSRSGAALLELVSCIVSVLPLVSCCVR